MYRFALRPRWLLSHLLVLALVVAMVSLGFWQLRRLDEKRTRNDLIEERMDVPPAPVDEVLDPASDADDAEEVLYRRVVASGTYLTEEEVLVRSRSLGGSPGAWVLTPLATGTGEAVVINRGWVPVTDPNGEVPGEARPPEGEVRVEGLVFPTQDRGRLGPRDPADGELDSLARADIERLQDQVDPDLYPAYVQLSEQAPQQEDLPLALDPPDFDEGPHLGYAVQWFIFSAIALGGYPLILRRVAHTRRRDAPEPDRPDERVPEPVA